MTATTTYPLHTASTGLTTAISRTLKAEWTKFHTLPSTWRMTVMAIVTSIGLGVILCASQASQWATMSRLPAPVIRPNRLLVRGRLPRRRRAARLARRAIRDRRIRHRDDPVHLHRHTHPTPRAGGQGSGQRGVRLPEWYCYAISSASKPASESSPPSTSKCPSGTPAYCRPSSSVPLE